MFTMPQMMLISVVLPAPFGPSSAKISPRRMSRSSGFSASAPCAYFFRNPRMDRTGSLICLFHRAWFDRLRILAHQPMAHQHRDIHGCEQEGEGEGAPQFEADPEIGGAVAHHRLIEHRHEDEE